MRKLLGALLAAGIATAAHAAPITLTLSGVIEQVGQNYFGGGVVDDFHPGDVMNLSLTYDPAMLAPIAPGPGIYTTGYSVPISEFTISTPAYTATVYNREALTLSDWGTTQMLSMGATSGGLMDGYGIPMAGVPLLEGDFLDSVGFDMFAPSGTFTAQSFSQPFELSDFTSGHFAFNFRQPITTYAMGTMQGWQILSLTSTAGELPEPSSVALFGLGAAGMLARRRRKAA